GGIVSSGPGDSPELLAEDIVRTGDGINNARAVRLVAREGPRLLEEYLAELVPFDRDDSGAFDWTREGGHSLRRILHRKDQTGKAIQDALLETLRREERVRFYPESIAVDLITNTHNSSDPQQKYRKRSIVGAYVMQNEEIQPMFSPAVVLATGGIGRIYLHSSNPPSATGDGIAMAYRAGCEIINAEYVQFHPTTLFHRDAERFLITEALRGEGARLMNRSGEYFMKRYHPQLRDLAPRDETARAIYTEMDSSSGFVLLDARGLKVNVPERFPEIYRRCRELDMDIEKEPFPVVPAAHYFCGGIKTNMNAAANIRGLYAVGESACTGLHGANRLASMSLLEGLVFAVRAAGDIAKKERRLKAELIESIPGWVYPKEETDFDPLLIDHDIRNIQTTMWNYVGITRSRKRLNRALADLNYYSHRIEQFYKEARASRNIIQLRNAVLTAGIVARAAQANPVSQGCHFWS
ncbi:MAG: L-aspartate oxidase, partial [Salinispira sp.]